MSGMGYARPKLDVLQEGVLARHSDQLEHLCLIQAFKCPDGVRPGHPGVDRVSLTRLRRFSIGADMTEICHFLARYSLPLDIVSTEICVLAEPEHSIFPRVSYSLEDLVSSLGTRNHATVSFWRNTYAF